jgi:hypothetical protein
MGIHHRGAEHAKVGMDLSLVQVDWLARCATAMRPATGDGRIPERRTPKLRNLNFDEGASRGGR